MSGGNVIRNLLSYQVQPQNRNACSVGFKYIARSIYNAYIYNPTGRALVISHAVLIHVHLRLEVEALSAFGSFAAMRTAFGI